MYKFPVGVLIDSFRCDYEISIPKAAKMGLTGIQLYTVSGDYAPENITETRKNNLLKLCNDNGMKISALCGDLGRGFKNSQLNPELIERSKKILYLAKEMGVDVVTTHIGVVPEDKTAPAYKIMQEACSKLAEFADSINSHFAVETGPEPSERLKEFLDSLHSTGVAVNLDPANLVMVAGDDPVQAVYNLKEYIVHTHAKDGKMLRSGCAEEVYSDVESHIEKQASFIELPLGQGNVDFEKYLNALDEIGYRGYLTIEREVGDNPEGDIKLAADYLFNIINR